MGINERCKAVETANNLKKADLNFEFSPFHRTKVVVAQSTSHRCTCLMFEYYAFLSLKCCLLLLAVAG